MGLIYTTTIILLLTLFMLIKKTEKKQNFMYTLGLGIVLILCYNVLECYILNFARIKLTLLNLSMVNLILIVLGVVYLLKKRKTQKYFIKVKDIIFSIILLFVVLVIANMQYGIPLKIKYETTDSAVHYKAAENFAKVDNLLNLEHDDLFGLETWKIGSYVNSGLIMKIFSNDMDDFYYYKIFIIFGLFTLYMIGYMMYCALVKFSKGKLFILAYVITILFVLGYPLNSLLYGYEYMSMGLLTITVLLYVIQLYVNKEISRKETIIIFFLLNFTLFHSYYQYVPYVYSAMFIYICYMNYKDDKKLFTKKNVIDLLISLILPFILGFIYYFAQGIYNLEFIFGSLSDVFEKAGRAQESAMSSFKIKGYVYNNLYSNIILLIPLFIYVIIKELKTKKTISFSSIAAIFTICYIILLVIGNNMKLVSDYYVTKNYFALWIFLWYINFKGLYYIYENKKKLPYILVFFYLIILTISYTTFNIETIENKLNAQKFGRFSEIYNVNKFLLKDNTVSYYNSELELMKYAKDNIIEKERKAKVELLGSEMQIIWAYPLLDYFHFYEEMSDQWFQKKLTYKHMNDEIIDNADYIICLYLRDFYNSYDKSKLDNLEVVYENAFGKILKNY